MTVACWILYNFFYSLTSELTFPKTAPQVAYRPHEPECHKSWDHDCFPFLLLFVCLSSKWYLCTINLTALESPSSLITPSAIREGKDTDKSYVAVYIH